VRLAGIIAAIVVTTVGTAGAQPDDVPGPIEQTPAPAPTPSPTPTPTPTPEPTPTPTPTPPPHDDRPDFLSHLQIHGFISEGGFYSTANNYIGDSATGSLEFFEAGLNVSTEITDRLRAGIQLFSRDEGTFRDFPAQIDWAFLDYRWKRWLGLRAGVVKMPFGLYNELVDIDAARTSILLPQAVYPLSDRSVLFATTGVMLYGLHELEAPGGSLEYQAWLGTLNVPADALELNGATLNSANTKYVAGGQLFWRTPLDGLRVGGTLLRAPIDFNLTFSSAQIAELIALGLVPPTYTGAITIGYHPFDIGLASAEYTYGDWVFAAEYERTFVREESTLTSLLPVTDANAEAYYAMVTRRFDRYLEAGAYYSVQTPDVNDRSGSNKKEFAEPFLAWQRDAAATLRFDVNDHWLWKLEGHFIDGAADLDAVANPHPERYWGMFLVRTTVTF
jgi:hypothetical protein